MINRETWKQSAGALCLIGALVGAIALGWSAMHGAPQKPQPPVKPQHHQVTPLPKPKPKVPAVHKKSPVVVQAPKVPEAQPVSLCPPLWCPR